MYAVTISDDEKWLERLSGRSEDAASADEQRQVDALRATMITQYHAEMDAMGESDPAQLDRLLERCRSEGLLEVKRRWWQQPLIPALVAVSASLLVVANIFFVNDDSNPVNKSEIIYRGGPDAPLELEKFTSEPAKMAALLKQQFESAGGHVLIYQAGADWHIKLDLEIPYSKAIQMLLNQYEIPAIEDKELRLVFKLEDKVTHQP